MRRFTLGAIILLAGGLMALPFRRSGTPDPSPTPPPRYGAPAEALDDRQIEMLVREVTADVDVPTLYEPQREMVRRDPAVTANTLPLTYADTAIPLDPDPVYQQRFSAVASSTVSPSMSTFAQASSPQVTTGDDAKATKIADFERRFAGKAFVDDSVAELMINPQPAQAIPPSQRRPSSAAPLVADQQPVPSAAAPLVVSPRSLEMTPSAPDQPGSRPQPYATLPASAARLTDTVRSGSTVRPSDQSILQSLPAGDSSIDPNANRPRHWIEQPE
ncbi:hypothetical protein [Roseiconus lacunae]|uniref:hypothetical protein n=1 Tax=Roseiconus lacunae TaxID=2605694 RepID=UPI0011F24EB5|nr:hypothetical protein [Roseiconus lacunae]